MKRRRRFAQSGIPVLALLLSAAPAIPQERGITLPVRHDHFLGSCAGTLVLDEHGVRFETNRVNDARTWQYEDLREITVESGRRLKLYTYEDRSYWRLGADRVFEFRWSEESPSPQQIYAWLREHSRSPIGAALIAPEFAPARFDLPVKHLGILKGTPGRLQFADLGVVFRAADERSSRSWRYQDIESIASGGPYDLTLTTYERQRFHYASRRDFNFQLREFLPRDVYDSLWRFVKEQKQRESR
ncbi:MAG TPA: hypothetical protein VNN17_02320 [Terriglobia bacterium]|nr:hypothetical protein [Terriglobia bacterium]